MRAALNFLNQIVKSSREAKTAKMVLGTTGLIFGAGMLTSCRTDDPIETEVSVKEHIDCTY